MASVYAQTKDVEFEVIVVDNASVDGSPEMVKQEFPGAMLIANCENRGFASANNQGFVVAKGRYVLLLNSDTIILDHAIDKAVAFADTRADAGVIGCRVLNADRSLQTTCFMFPSMLNMLLMSSYLYKVFPKSRFFGRARMSWWDRSDVREVDVVAGCFMLVRREAMDRVGGMDEQFFMYSEETDWCYRFWQAGWKVIYAPVCEIIHYLGASSKQRQQQMTLQVWGSTLQFFRKHSTALVYGAACSLVALFFMLRAPYWLVRAVFSGKERRASLLTAKTYLLGSFYALAGGRRLCTNG